MTMKLQDVDKADIASLNRSHNRKAQKLILCADIGMSRQALSRRCGNSELRLSKAFTRTDERCLVNIPVIRLACVERILELRLAPTPQRLARAWSMERLLQAIDPMLRVRAKLSKSSVEKALRVNASLGMSKKQAIEVVMSEGAKRHQCYRALRLASPAIAFESDSDE